MLAGMPREARFGVFEIGMNHAGEITPLVKLVRPHIAVVTTVAAAHLEFFKSVTDIAEAKAEIFLGLEPGGTALLNSDHDYLHVLFAKSREAKVGQVVTYGYDENADWRIAAVDVVGGMTVARVEYLSQQFSLNLRLRGRHMVANAVAALAVSQLSGEGTSRAIRALAQFEAPEGRGETTRLGPEDGPLLLVDESYNANIASMQAAMDVFAGQRPSGGQKVLVLGDMLELGTQGPQLHRSLKRAVLETRPDRIYLVGPAMAALADELGDAVPLVHADTIDHVADDILSSLAYGDAVMVKGSKGVRLGYLVKKIRERF